jgi:cytochrome c peroxidase
MRKFLWSSGLLLASLAVVILSGVCGDAPAGNVNVGDVTDPAKDGFSPQEWALIQTLSPLPDLPVDTTNKYRDSRAAALLGQKLFFEPRLSGPIQTGTPAEGQLGAIGDTGKIACRNCHMPESGWLFDIRSNNGGPIPNATALGSLWMTRNVSSVVNTVFYINPESGAHWRENDGFSDSEWFDAQSEPEGPPVQNGSRLQLAHVLFEHYHDDYNAAFPEWPLDKGLANYHRFPATGSPYTDTANWNSLSPQDKEIINRILVNYGKAIEAYPRKLVSRNAPFDRYVAGESAAISDAAKKGLKLFIVTGCAFFVAQTLRASVQVEVHSMIQKRCDEKNAWDAEPEHGTGMRMIATFSGPCVSHALTSHVSVFFHNFKDLEQLPKLATSSFQGGLCVWGLSGPRCAVSAAGGGARPGHAGGPGASHSTAHGGARDVCADLRLSGPAWDRAAGRGPYHQRHPHAPLPIL